MPSRKEIEGKSLEAVADLYAHSGPESPNDRLAQAEFLLRQSQFQERQAKAAEEAARAAVATAQATARYTKYMLWSVVVLTLSSIATLVVALAKGG